MPNCQEKPVQIQGNPTPDKRIWGSLDPFIEAGDILGRKVANASFLTALLDENPYDAYHFFLRSSNEIESLSQWLQSNYTTLWNHGYFLLKPQIELHKYLGSTVYHCFHLSDCLTHQVPLTRLRNALAKNIFPITGQTHSLSYVRFMPAFLEHYWAGNTPKDSIIASSRSAKSMLARVFGKYKTTYPLPYWHKVPSLLPRVDIIPLGVNPKDVPNQDDRWDTGTTPQKARELRTSLHIDDKVMFLCLGRISHFSKMDLLPVLSAFKRAEALGLPKSSYCIVLAGFTEPEASLPGLLKEYSKALGIELITVLNPDNALRSTLYAAADVFLSPADNLQETFGLTVVEAGLSGLPVIVSDFNGYKDTVIHGQTGFLVPTIALEDTTETNVLASLWFDNQYHFKIAQSTMVDVPTMAMHIANLGCNIGLRQSMGQKAREYTINNFSWPVVIKKYIQLWDSLSKENTAERHILESTTHPLGMDFGYFFASHSSTTTTKDFLDQAKVQITKLGQAVFQKTIQPFAYSGLENFFDKEEIHHLLFIARKEIALNAALEKIIQHMPDSGHPCIIQEKALSLILWCLKNDYIELAEPISIELGAVKIPDSPCPQSQAGTIPSSAEYISDSSTLKAEQQHLAILGKQLREIMHDMRTPLAIINGSGELIKEIMEEETLDKEDTDQIIKAARMICKHSEGLVELIEKTRFKKN